MVRYILSALLLSTPAFAEDPILDPNMHIPVFGVDRSPDPEYNRLIETCLQHRADTGLIRPDHKSVYFPPEYNEPCHEVEARWANWVHEIQRVLAEQRAQREASDLEKLKSFKR